MHCTKWKCCHNWGPTSDQLLELLELLFATKNQVRQNIERYLAELLAQVNQFSFKPGDLLVLGVHILLVLLQPARLYGGRSSGCCRCLGQAGLGLHCHHNTADTFSCLLYHKRPMIYWKYFIFSIHYTSWLNWLKIFRLERFSYLK